MAKNNAARVNPFAHLLGLPSANISRAEEDDQEKKDRDARRAEEDKQRAEEDDRREKEDARRAEEDGDGAGANEDDKPPKDGKKADKKDGDDEECDEEDDTTDMSKGRKAERARWVKVFSHPVSAGRVASAASLLSRGRASSAEVIETLATLPAAGGAAAPAPTGRSRLADRMDQVETPNPGSGASTGGKGDFAAQMAAAVAKARPTAEPTR